MPTSLKNRKTALPTPVDAPTTVLPTHVLTALPATTIVRLHEFARDQGVPCDPLYPAMIIDFMLERWTSRPVPYKQGLNTSPVIFEFQGKAWNISKMARYLDCAPAYFSMAKDTKYKLEETLERFGVKTGRLTADEVPELAQRIYDAYRNRGAEDPFD